MDTSNKNIEEIVRRVLENMTGGAKASAPAASAASSGAVLPKTARVAMLVEKEKYEIKEYPLPEVGDNDILVKVEGCGICGTESLEGVMRPLNALPFTQRFDLKHYGAGLAGIAQTEELRSLTGGTHAAVWLRHDGTVAFGREDVGRHVALDKLLGCRARTKEHDGALFVSSRASYEMVQKAAACGVEILFAVSAPTALAVEVAQRCNLTLAAFCRDKRANIYTHPQRLIGL